MVHLTSIHNAYEVIEYYISLKEDRIVKEVHKDLGRTQAYYYSISEFIRDNQIPRKIRDVVIQMWLSN
jgi:hypothetical protein